MRGIKNAGCESSNRTNVMNFKISGHFREILVSVDGFSVATMAIKGKVRSSKLRMVRFLFRSNAKVPKLAEQRPCLCLARITQIPVAVIMATLISGPHPSEVSISKYFLFLKSVQFFPI